VWIKIEIEDVKKMMNKIMYIEGIFCWICFIKLRNQIP
jgi:hypothetical protein